MTDHDENLSSRQRGRPSRGDEPDVSWDQIDRLLVHGEEMEENDGAVNYPSYRDLGERFGVSKSLISKYSQEHNCMERRQYEQGTENKKRLAEEQLQKSAQAKKPITRKDLLSINDYLIRKFEEALHDGRVRVDSVSDYLQIMKMRKDLTGNAEQDATHPNDMPTLEELQKRHEEERKRIQEMVPEMFCLVDSNGQYDKEKSEAIMKSLREEFGDHEVSSE